MAGAISMQDLENAKTDVDHIAEVATSLAPTATDRLGHVKQTLAGAVASIAATTDRGAWATGAVYVIKDLVTVAGIVYVCVSGHTAGATFEGDSAKWRVYQGVLEADLADQTDPLKGAGIVGRAIASFADYAGVRALTSDCQSETVYVTGHLVTQTQSGIVGVFQLDTLDTTSADDNATVLIDASGRRWKRDYTGPLNVKWFGALGDNTGRTPADDGVDVISKPWNTWDGTPFKDDVPWSPYGTGGTFNPPRAKPFANDDTWDFIGISLAMWKGVDNKQAAYIPSGHYLINMYSSTTKGTYPGLVIMRGMEQAIYGDGAYETTISPKEDTTWFGVNNPLVVDTYPLVSFYRVGGPPTTIRDLALIGPYGYYETSKNLTLLLCLNINGVTVRDLWLSSAYRGIAANTNSGDSHIKGVTSEFCFGQSIYTDASSAFNIDFCNLWSSSANASQQGIVALGYAAITNCRFVEFAGGAVDALTGVFGNNLVVQSSGAGVGVLFKDKVTITGNTFSGASTNALLRVWKNASVCGNVFEQNSNHPCMALGDGDAATNITVTGNTFKKASAASEAQNYAIIADKSGVGYTSAATASCIIAKNTFQGRAMYPLGAATMSRNIIDGVLHAEVFTGDVELRGDVLGKEITSGTGSTSPFTITITGIIGQGEGSERSQQRLTLVSVYTTGASHVGHAFALYTTEYNGNAILVATLGSSVVGGSIVFGVSGINPTAVVTNSGGTVSYKVNAVPLV